MRCGCILRSLGGLALKSALLLFMLLAMTALVLAPSPGAAVSLTRGMETPLCSSGETLSVHCWWESTTLNEALVGPETLDLTLAIEATKVEYDFLNTSSNTIVSWTLFFDRSFGPKIIGAAVPTGYINSSGSIQLLGGQATPILFNNGYGAYSYNTDAAWTVDYQANRITFIGDIDRSPLPVGAACGATDAGFTPAFAVFFAPDVPVGYDAATATAAGSNDIFAGVVVGPSQFSVPEPSALLALTVGAIGLWGWKCRR